VVELFTGAKDKYYNDAWQSFLHIWLMHVMALHHKYLYDPVALSTTSAVLLRFAGDVLSHSHVHDNK